MKLTHKHRSRVKLFDAVGFQIDTSLIKSYDTKTQKAVLYLRATQQLDAKPSSRWFEPGINAASHLGLVHFESFSLA